MNGNTDSARVTFIGCSLDDSELLFGVAICANEQDLREIRMMIGILAHQIPGRLRCRCDKQGRISFRKRRFS